MGGWFLVCQATLCRPQSPVISTFYQPSENSLVKGVHCQARFEQNLLQINLSLLTQGLSMLECNSHSRLVLRLLLPPPLETRSLVGWQAWLMPMDCFFCHQGGKNCSQVKVEVNTDANAMVKSIIVM